MNAKDFTDNRTCLHIASNHGYLQMLSILLQSTMVDKESTDIRSQTPLITACLSQQLTCVKLLIKHGCNLNHKDIDGQTALSIACQLGNYTIVDELLKAGAQIYASTRNPIKLAHQSGNLELVSLLQYWSTLCYQHQHQQYQQQHQHQQQQNHQAPRNSKSVESFRSSSARLSSSQPQSNSSQEKEMPNFNNRCAITPTTFSSYMRNLGHISSSISASPLVTNSVEPGGSKFEMFSARNFRAADSRSSQNR